MGQFSNSTTVSKTASLSIYNKVPNCTKDKANAPLGVCSITDAEDNIAVVCPIRFRQDWIIAEDAAAFFFRSGEKWTSLTEVRLNDRHGDSAGNIDLVLVSYDDSGHITDFGSLEIQAVYISGNIRRPFENYMENPEKNHDMDWSKKKKLSPPGLPFIIEEKTCATIDLQRINPKIVE